MKINIVLKFNLYNKEQNFKVNVVLFIYVCECVHWGMNVCVVCIININKNKSGKA